MNEKHERMLRIAALVRQIETEMQEDDNILAVDVSKWSCWTNIHVFTANGKLPLEDYTDRPVERVEIAQDGGDTRIEHRSTVDGVPLVDMYLASDELVQS